MQSAAFLIGPDAVVGAECGSARRRFKGEPR